jgi:hypothetical protein
MLGIEDPLIWLAYVCCVLVTALSVGYGLARRNSAADRLTREDRAWARVEKKVEDEL